MLDGEHRLKHHHTVWFCSDGLICCLFTGLTVLLRQADWGTDPRAQLKLKTGNDLSSTPSSLTMANGLRGLLSKVSSHEKEVCSQSVKSHTKTDLSPPKMQNVCGSWGRNRWQTIINSLQTRTGHMHSSQSGHAGIFTLNPPDARLFPTNGSAHLPGVKIWLPAR